MFYNDDGDCEDECCEDYECCFDVCGLICWPCSDTELGGCILPGSRLFPWLCAAACATRTRSRNREQHQRQGQRNTGPAPELPPDINRDRQDALLRRAYERNATTRRLLSVSPPSTASSPSRRSSWDGSPLSNGGRSSGNNSRNNRGNLPHDYVFGVQDDARVRKVFVRSMSETSLDTMLEFPTHPTSAVAGLRKRDSYPYRPSQEELTHDNLQNLFRYDMSTLAALKARYPKEYHIQTQQPAATITRLTRSGGSNASIRSPPLSDQLSQRGSSSSISEPQYTTIQPTAKINYPEYTQVVEAQPEAQQPRKSQEHEPVRRGSDSTATTSGSAVSSSMFQDNTRRRISPAVDVSVLGSQGRVSPRLSASKMLHV